MMPIRKNSNPGQPPTEYRAVAYALAILLILGVQIAIAERAALMFA